MYVKNIPLVERMSRNELGARAPIWIPDEHVTRCACSNEFGLTRRKHHCRACGQIFCSDCTSKKAKLKFANNKSERVCDECYDILKGRGKEKSCYLTIL